MPTPVPSPPAQGNVQKPPSPKPAPSPLHHLVTFSLGAELFGIDIKQIQEIIRHQEVCPVPNSPPYMEGLINLRGRILPVISLRRKLGMMDTERGVSGGAAREPSPTADAEGERPEDTRTRRIIIVSAKGSLIGLLVDSVKEVMHLPVSVVDPPGTVAGPEAMEYIIGVGKLEDSHLLSILDLEKLLADL
ncbi:MAG: chemotaxis protein CheW [Nitrospirae bacterium]|nr:chemotaxis protein CheW [Nitrospirota bacterium]